MHGTAGVPISSRVRDVLQLCSERRGKTVVVFGGVRMLQGLCPAQGRVSVDVSLSTEAPACGAAALCRLVGSASLSCSEQVGLKRTWSLELVPQLSSSLFLVNFLISLGPGGLGLSSI
jgi:hypothetical protein